MTGRSSPQRSSRNGRKKTRRRVSEVARLEISLDSVEPRVWRRIEISYSSTFWELHVAIQDAMGWTDSHLHAFLIRPPRGGPPVSIGIPDPDAPRSSEDLPGWEVALDAYLTPETPEAVYIYDFGDDWRHSIRLEHVGRADPDRTYPRCLAGERACPPEDIGGPPGYEELLAALSSTDPGEEEGELLEWVGEDFDPEAFEPRQVRFSDPALRLKRLLRAD